MKIRMKYFLMIWLILFMTIESNAQTDFRDGYIVDNNDDTIYGLLGYRGSKASVNSCVFKKDTNSEKQMFTAEEIKSFRFIDDKYYVSKSVVIGDETKKIFLEYLIDGIVDVYYYRDGEEHYFIDDGTGGLRELKNDKTVIQKGNTKYTRESKQYIGMLKYSFRESPSISNKAEMAVLNHKSLIKLAENYHYEVCSDKECIVYEKAIPKMKHFYGVLIGVNSLSGYEESDLPDTFDYFNNSDFGTNIFPSIGLYYKASIPYINDHVYFQYEISYSQLKLETSNVYVRPVSGNTHTNDISLGQKTINNLAMIKYESSKGKIRPTIQLGLFYRYHFDMDFNRRLLITGIFADEIEEFEENIFSEHEYGLNFGIGFKTAYLKDKELNVDLRYQAGFRQIYTPRGAPVLFNSNTFSINLGFQIGE